MDNGKLERIARKVVKAEEIYECSYEKAGGSSKTVWIVQDGQFTEPVRMIIKKLGDDSFDVMCFKKSFYAKKSKNDEYYTRMEDIEKELAYYAEAFAG